jgi:UDP-N-acetylglucosamine 4-epimerase|tara:strand:+ start:4738 stop:5727 length:990 start_codon:yes stop_codon:yes gene_type:complete
MVSSLKNKTILVTGGAGFIGSNLCEALLDLGANVRCLDNLSTGFMHNIQHFIAHNKFSFIEGDILDLETCQNACKDIDFVLHQAALGSVPRSVKDPITTNAVNIGGFLNMLVAARDQGVKRMVFAASSSTYGDSEKLPKVEQEIGQPLSPYAITKYVNELYATIFKRNYNLDTIGLRYFNVFGRKQDPNGAYAAVIPKFVIQLINHESPVINGDGSFSRDFTYIDNVIAMNLLAITTKNKKALNQIYNAAVGDRTTLTQLVNSLRKYLTKFDTAIANIKIIYGPQRVGDIPHSQASIDKANQLLNYKPTHGFEAGLKEAVEWYWEKFKN